MVQINVDGSKAKDMRAKQFGGRQAYTAYQVITPILTPHPDMCIMNYDAFRGVNKLRIKELLTQKGFERQVIVDILDIDRPLSRAYKDVLDGLVEETVFVNIINRQPSIYESSTRALTVWKLSDDEALKLSHIVVYEFRGDFDGDALNIFSIEDGDMLYMLHTLNPRRTSVSFERKYTGETGIYKDAMLLTHMVMRGEVL